MLKRFFFAVVMSTVWIGIATLANQPHDPILYGALALILSNQFYNMEERRK